MTQNRSTQRQPIPQAAVPSRPSRHSDRVALGGFVFSLVTVQGLTINLMPLLFGPVARTFEVNLRQQGQLQSFCLGGGVVALFVSGYVTERIGARRSGMLAVSLIGLGILLLAFSRTYWQVLAAATMTGLGNMWILSAYSAVIAMHFFEIRQRMFMFATAAFAGSAALSTTLFGRLFEIVPDWRTVFLGFALVIAVWLLFGMLLASRHMAVLDETARETSRTGSRGSGGLGARVDAAFAFLAEGLLNRPAFWLLATLVFLDIVAAGNIVTWTARLFQIEYGVGDDQVGLMLSSSSMGVFLGRLCMGGFASERIGDRPLLGSCYAAGILMYVLLLLIPSYRLGLLLIFLNGAFLGAQAPTMYAISSAQFGPRAATAIPLIDGIGVLGGLTTPVLVGVLADQYGLSAVLWFIPAIGALFVAIVFAWEMFDRRYHQRTRAESRASDERGGSRDSLP